MSILVWSMVGIAMWHFAVLVPDKFWGGTVGAFLVAVAGALLTGYPLPTPGIPTANPPGLEAGLYAFPGSVLGLVASYFYGHAWSAETIRATQQAESPQTYLIAT